MPGHENDVLGITKPSLGRDRSIAVLARVNVMADFLFDPLQLCGGKSSGPDSFLIRSGSDNHAISTGVEELPVQVPEVISSALHVDPSVMRRDLGSLQQRVKVSEVSDDRSNFTRSFDIFLVNQVRIFDDFIMGTRDDFPDRAR
jgi:hypothetical protein